MSPLERVLLPFYSVVENVDKYKSCGKVSTPSLWTMHGRNFTRRGEGLLFFEKVYSFQETPVLKEAASGMNKTWKGCRVSDEYDLGSEFLHNVFFHVSADVPSEL